MPLVISRPAQGLEQVATNLRSRSYELTDELASLAQGAVRSYTPNHWKRLLYKAVGNKAHIPGGHGVGGPLGRGGLLPDPRPAPRGTIAEFLVRHPEFVTRPRLKEGQPYTPRGRSFPRAWQHLPVEARELLKNERLAGMYRSGAPAAPYWLIAEHGSGEGVTSVDVGVPARYYLRNSRAAVERGVPLVTRRVLGML